jgi:transposase
VRGRQDHDDIGEDDAPAAAHRGGRRRAPHCDTHTAAAVDTAGRLLGDRQFPATAAGYRQLLAWLRSFGALLVVGVEGTGAYGAGLARHLTAEDVAMVEVDRPDRKARRFAGKSDPLDAEAAARAALAGVRTGTPKDRSGQVEALRNLRVARRSAIDQRADCQRRIKSLIVTAPEPLRVQLRGLKDARLIATCAALRPDPARIGDPEQAAKTALRSLARRHTALSEEIDDLDALIGPLVTAINPDLTARTGVGADVAGQLLVTAGQNADRLHSEPAFAMLCGVAPIPASSGRTNRHRLNRGGGRPRLLRRWRPGRVRHRRRPGDRPPGAHARRRRATLARLGDRLVAELHGSCVGAGIELPAWAARVVAAPDTQMMLPELAMGLLPGVGGTVSIPRRIGCWRTLWLALTGQALDAATALGAWWTRSGRRRPAGALSVRPHPAGPARARGARPGPLPQHGAGRRPVPAVRRPGRRAGAARRRRRGARGTASALPARLLPAQRGRGPAGDLPGRP